MSSPVLPDNPPLDVPAVIVPDRADAPISEITERFFRAVLLKVPLDRIEELHLFSPLRQGGVETGIAVIAAREVLVPPVAESHDQAPVSDPELPLEAPPVADAVESLDADAPADEILAEASLSESGLVETGLGKSVHVESSLQDSADAEDTLEDALVVDTPETVAAAAAPAPKIRHTVLTARYRLVQKGPERGKWEADVVAEAEAPLITVETVVRGVQRRAGEESDTTRFTAPQIARALRLDVGAA